MAIPTYRERLQTAPGGGPGMVRVPNVSDGIGAALARAGTQIEQAGAQVTATQERVKAENLRRQTEVENRDVLQQSITLESKMLARLQEMQTEAPEDGAGVLDKVEEEIQLVESSFVQQYQTEEAQARAAFLFGRAAQSIREKAAGFQASATANVNKRKTESALQEAEKIVGFDAGRFSSMAEQTLRMVDELPGLDVRQRQELGQEITERLAFATIRGGIERSPYQVLKSLSASPESPANDVFSTAATALDFDKLERLRSAARSEINRREGEARARQAAARDMLSDELRDAFAARQAGIPAQLPSRARFVAAYGAEGAKRYTETAKTWTVYDAVGEAALLPIADAQTVLDRFKPGDQSGAAGDMERYNMAVKLYREQRRQLETDPAGVLLQRDPQLAQLRAAANETGEPGAVQTYIREMRAKQQALGVRNTRLLPESERVAIADRLAFDPQKPGQRSQFIGQMSQLYGQYMPDVLREVAPKLDGAARVMAGMTPSDAARFDRAQLAAKETADLLPKEDKQQVRDVVLAEFQPVADTLNAAPDRNERLAEMVSAATVMANDLVSRGSSPKDAARQSVQAVAMANTHYVGTMRIPRQYDPDSIQSGARTWLQKELPKAAIAGNDPGGTATRFMTDAERAAARTANIQRRGQWVTAGDNSGLRLVVQQGDQFKPVVYDNGAPVALSWDELNEMGRGEPVVVRPEDRAFEFGYGL